MKTLYEAEVTATGGREGKIQSKDGVLDLKLAIPKGLGGPGGAATNPEQLFAAGYAACFESAVRLVARQRKVALTSASVTALVGIGQSEDGAFALQARLTVSLPGVERSVAEGLTEAAHGICPYSRATRGNIQVDLAVAE